MLPMLLEFYRDPGLVLDLMHSGALSFIIHTHGVMSIGSVVISGQSPITLERDAASLAEFHLSSLSGLSPTMKAKLVASFAASTVQTDAISAAEAVALVERFADRGCFGDLVPDSSAFVNAESSATTDAARHIAEDIFATSVVLRNEYDIFETDGTWEAMIRIAKDIRHSVDVVDAIEHVYKEAAVPSIRALIRDGNVTPAEIVKQRDNGAARSFRSWLWKAEDPNDGPGLAQQYVRALDRGLDIKDGRLYRN